MKRWGVRVLVGLILTFIVQSTALAQKSDGNIWGTFEGYIAYIGEDYNVYTVNLADGSSIQLTQDAFQTETLARYYEWPTWSTDGRLAYFLTTVNIQQGRATSAELNAYISHDARTVGEHVYSGTNEILQYAYWSPEDCDTESNCRDLAVLLSGVRQGQASLFIELIRDSADGASSQFIGRGGPFYYSWSPDGKQMLWQRSLQTMDVYDIASASVINTLPQAPGFFQAPSWSPIDDRLLFGALGADTQSTDLVVVANGQTKTLASGLRGPVAFAWSPDGNSVAYVDRQGPLIVVDAITGETIQRSSTTGVLAFFWSPNSNSIAFVTLATPPGSFSAKASPVGVLAAQQTQVPSLAWSVLHIESGVTHRYGSFQPTRQMWYLLLYFDQFAQSHRVWSPNGSYLIYSEMTTVNQPVISILDVTQPDSVPFAVANGFIGVWSFE